jgi:lipopolysaccharide export system permease protein
MLTVLPAYLRRHFLYIFLFSLVGVLVLFVVVDLVENLDRFIDAKAPLKIIILYYLYFMPYILALTVPVGTLLAAVFSIGSLARNNELVAAKALGYSFYQVLGNLLWMGFWIGIISFFVAEGVVAKTNQRKEQIRRKYLDRVPESVSTQFRNLVIQNPPDKIISIEYFNSDDKTAHRIKIESFQKNRLVSRIDAPIMRWNGKIWIVINGYQRIFSGNKEEAVFFSKPIETDLQFTPKELLMSQVKPDEMDYLELRHFIDRLKQSKGNVKRWMTDLYFRVSFPMSNFIIVFLSVPLVYNVRRKNLAVGFGISLLICFLFFGMVKLGQTLGHNMTVHPLIAAWMGNTVAGVLSIVNVLRVRK